MKRLIKQCNCILMSFGESNTKFNNGGHLPSGVSVDRTYDFVCFISFITCSTYTPLPMKQIKVLASTLFTQCFLRTDCRLAR